MQEIVFNSCSRVKSKNASRRSLELVKGISFLHLYLYLYLGVLYFLVAFK